MLSEASGLQFLLLQVDSLFHILEELISEPKTDMADSLQICSTHQTFSAEVSNGTWISLKLDVVAMQLFT